MQMVLGVHVTVMQIIENTEDNTATLWTSKSIYLLSERARLFSWAG